MKLKGTYGIMVSVELDRRTIFCLSDIEFFLGRTNRNSLIVRTFLNNNFPANDIKELTSDKSKAVDFPSQV